MKKHVLQVRFICLGVVLCLVFLANTLWAGSQSIDPSRYTKKVDNFLFLFDSSESMQGMHNGNTKLYWAKNIVSRMNQTIPDMQFTGGLRAFGRGYGLFSINQSKLLYGMNQHTPAGLDCALGNITFAAGNTPLATALRKTGYDLQGLKGTIALIVVSDGKSTDSGPIEAAKNLKQQFGDRLCIYTIVAGNAPEGIQTMKQIAAAGGCGFMTIGDRLMDDGRMHDFVVRVFLERKVADVVPIVAIPVQKAKVADKIVLRAIQFDFDSSVIGAEYYPILDEAASILSGHKDKKIVVEGHTCSMGPESYNMGLSQHRANAVATYLGQKGIPAKNFIIEPYGESNPMADNTTIDGRRKNRRVELKVMQ